VVTEIFAEAKKCRNRRKVDEDLNLTKGDDEEVFILQRDDLRLRHVMQDNGL